MGAPYSSVSGGEGGIRTLGEFPHTRLAGVRLQPLGHLSGSSGGGRGTRTPMGFHPAVFKTAALPIRTSPPAIPLASVDPNCPGIPFCRPCPTAPGATGPRTGRNAVSGKARYYLSRHLSRRPLSPSLRTSPALSRAASLSCVRSTATAGCRERPVRCKSRFTRPC